VGAVNAPSAVAFAPGQNIDDYVRAAGGPGPNADQARAYVRQPNGKVESVRRRRFLPDHVPTVRAGATVVVPAGSAAANSLQQTLGFIQAVVGILTGLATALVLVNQIN
jgi:protein involved in polysaccharide export with SLBB domain